MKCTYITFDHQSRNPEHFLKFIFHKFLNTQSIYSTKIIVEPWYLYALRLSTLTLMIQY